MWGCVCEGVSPEEVAGGVVCGQSVGFPWPSEGCGHSPRENRGTAISTKIGLRPVFPALSAFSPHLTRGHFFSFPFFLSFTITLSPVSGQKDLGICFTSLLLGTISKL